MHATVIYDNITCSSLFKKIQLALTMTFWNNRACLYLEEKGGPDPPPHPLPIVKVKIGQIHVLICTETRPRNPLRI